jgi:hypothetical protein
MKYYNIMSNRPDAQPTVLWNWALEQINGAWMIEQYAR